MAIIWDTTILANPTKGLPSDYGMFSAAGNRAVARLVEKTARNVASGEWSRIRAVDEIRKTTARIAVQHPEVHDTDVREQIACSLDRVFHAAGLMPLSGI